jgi:hypothetical protein
MGHVPALDSLASNLLQCCRFQLWDKGGAGLLSHFPVCIHTNFPIANKIACGGMR